MMDFLYRWYSEAVLEVLAWLRRVASANGRLYAAACASPAAFPPLAFTGAMRAPRLVPESKTAMSGVWHVP